MKDILTVKEAAPMLGISADTLYEWGAAKKIPSYRFSRSIRLKRVDIEAYREAQRVEAEGS